ncbi:MAG: anaerobic ribonucleoside-triphosphate reductase activating protein [Oscillospiraceae bacterium]|nr:anaerobic ribonucleoside-triphosphate reductase activating protein [Oscillospiraceae bacterium]
MENQKIRIAKIEKESIVDGPGLRLAVFVQGCPHRCAGCHNPQTHSFDGGQIISANEIAVLAALNPLLQGITFSGGEPFCQAEPLAALAVYAKSKGLDVVTYTGYTFEELIESEMPGVFELLNQTDILIDGRYQQDKRDLTLKFRGSSNQRMLDCQTSLAKGYAVLY